MNKNAIEVQNLTVEYDGKIALWGVDLKISHGGRIGIVGPNGSGKSTLLKALLGLVPVMAGSVRIFGEPARESLSRVAYVPQRAEVDWDFPVSVNDVVMMGRFRRRRWYESLKKDDHKAVREAIARVGMGEFSSRPIAQLSGGQQQRVFLARALAAGGDIFVLDEPFNGIDFQSEEDLRKVIRDLAREGKTVLMVHHDLSRLTEDFDKIVLLKTKVLDFGAAAEVCKGAAFKKVYGWSSQSIVSTQFSSEENKSLDESLTELL